MNNLFGTRSAHNLAGLLSPADRLRLTTVPSRVRFRWLPAVKALTPEQKDLAARPFGAAGPGLSAAKRLIEARHPAVRAVTAVRGRIESYWQSVSLPFPEPCVWLLPLAEADDFARRLSAFAGELAAADSGLGRAYDDLRRAASARLGALFDPGDFPPSPRDFPDVDRDFPGVAAPPANLASAWGSLHILEEARIKANYNRAVELAEAEFREEFARLLGRLCDGIADADGHGGRKALRDSTVLGLIGFLVRYDRFDLRTDDRLDELIALAQQALHDVTPQELRRSRGARRTLAARLSWIRVSLDAMRDDLPRDAPPAGPPDVPAGASG
jgi:hypothetical protein